MQTPSKTDSIECWQKWIKVQDRLERAEKARHTRSLPYAEVVTGSGLRKYHGKYTQCVSLGFGDEAVVEASQEQDLAFLRMEQTRHQRGGSVSRKTKNSRRRANRKAR